MFECNGRIFCVGSNSKAMPLPASWGLRNGDWVKIIVDLNERQYICTLPVRKFKTSRTYITCPRDWNVEIGDSFHIKLAFANIPRRE